MYKSKLYIYSSLLSCFSGLVELLLTANEIALAVFNRIVERLLQ